MSKSSPRLPFGRKPATGTVTVIETKVHRSSARNAKLAFYLTLTIVGLLTATIAADQVHPVLALALGIATGVGSGLVAWVIVRVWPVVRLLWWWAPEITLALAVVYGWTVLARQTHPLVRLLVVALVVGVPAGVPAIRRHIVALAWCVIVRHRLRVCFTEFIITNQSGTLPLILWARPTPVGERVWIYLRPGLSLADLESRLEKIAVACHAATVTVERASEGNAAFLRVDIKRRDVLAATVGSPLVELVDPTTPPTQRPIADLPTALDLPDVAADQVAEATPRPEPRKPAPAPTPASASSKGAASAPTITATVTAGGVAEDLSDWI